MALIAVLIAGYALVAARLDRISLGSALAFVVIGFVLSDDVFGPLSIDPDTEAVKVLAEATLTLLLFADASSLRARALSRDAVPIARLLAFGLPLTILAGVLLVLGLFPGIPFGIALLIAAALAPTDAALGQPVVTNKAVPARIRRVLNVESGLNDGIATPIVFLALALTAAETTGGSHWIADALVQAVIGVGVGIGLGMLGGYLLQLADSRRWTSALSRQLFVLALAASCYLVALAVGGTGFIAAFVGGLAFGLGSSGREETAVRFTETQGSLLAIGVWTAFGLTLAGELFSTLGNPQVVAYAVLSLTVIRMVPVAISLIGARFKPITVLFIGWFGPRGLASIVFLIIGLEGLSEAGVDTGPLAAVVAWTVLLSVVLHGLTAGPLAAWYGRRMASLAPDAPEFDGPDPEASRLSWAAHHRIEPKG